MANQKIRTEAKKYKVPLWKIANELGHSDVWLSKKMRFEFSKEETEKVLSIIKKLSKQ